VIAAFDRVHRLSGCCSNALLGTADGRLQGAKHCFSVGVSSRSGGRIVTESRSLPIVLKTSLALHSILARIHIRMVERRIGQLREDRRNRAIRAATRDSCENRAESRRHGLPVARQLAGRSTPKKFAPQETSVHRPWRFRAAR
jgi:hypothetical protein